MPLTFPSHLAPVLPLKLWRPRWFDGVALSTGAVAPDVGYLFAGTRFDLGQRTHTLAGLLWWCLPVALGYAWLVRRTVAGIAAHLPGERVFAWHRYAALRDVRHPWRVAIWSALVGAASHVGWDWLTHTDHWLRLFGIADFHAATGIHWWSFSDLLSTILGAVVVVGLAVCAGRRHEIVDAAPPAPPARPALFWGVAGAVAAVGVPVLAALPVAAMPAPSLVRLLHVAAVALILGAVAAGGLGTGGRVTGRADRLVKKQRHVG
ncbi:MAG: DUF4184 family protein [Micromonospora sp.]